MKTALHYPGFKYSGTELLKYMTISIDFTIMLKDADIIQYVPDNEITLKNSKSGWMTITSRILEKKKTG